MDNPIGPWPLSVIWYEYPDSPETCFMLHTYGYKPNGELVRYEAHCLFSQLEMRQAISNPHLMGQRKENVYNSVITFMQNDATAV